jgi:hypothetical protein
MNVRQHTIGRGTGLDPLLKILGVSRTASYSLSGIFFTVVPPASTKTESICAMRMLN